MPQGTRVDADLDLEKVAETGGNMAEFPWDDWTDGGTWMAREGRDFPTSPRAFKNKLEKEARQRYLLVTIAFYGPEVWFQFKPLAPAPPIIAALRAKLPVAALSNGHGSG